MTKARNNYSLPWRLARESFLTRRVWLIICALMVMYAPLAIAETDDECREIKREFKDPLNWPSNKLTGNALAERHKYFKFLFSGASRNCAIYLVDSFMDTRQNELSMFRLFNDELEEPERKELLEILDHRISFVSPDDAEGGGKGRKPEREVSTVGADHASEVHCTKLQDELGFLLNQKYTRSDKEGLAERRQILNSLFENSSQSCAITLYYQLRNDKQDDLSLYKLFNHKLAAPTRNQLLGILVKRMELSGNEAVDEGVRTARSGSKANEPFEADAQCMQDHEDLVTALSWKFTKSDKFALQERRKFLNDVVRETSSSCAKLLLNRIGYEPNSSPISDLFHHKLASPVRTELLGRLEKRSDSQPTSLRERIPLIPDGSSNQMGVE